MKVQSNDPSKSKTLRMVFILLLMSLFFFPYNNGTPFAIQATYKVKMKLSGYKKVEEINHKEQCIRFINNDFYIKEKFLGDQSDYYEIVYFKYLNFSLKTKGASLIPSRGIHSEFINNALNIQAENSNVPFIYKNSAYFFDQRFDATIIAPSIEGVKAIISSLVKCNN